MMADAELSVQWGCAEDIFQAVQVVRDGADASRSALQPAIHSPC
jgi:hypothetical protein